MKNLRIASGLALPLEAVTQAIGILAKRRAGKSYTMRRFAEQLLKAGQQVVIVDPKGDQWGIRSASDGVSPGLPVVILGGERADVPLEVHSGEVVAKLVVEDRVSVLLDLSLFRKSEVATFMAIFLENLYRLKSREVYRTPMMLIIDEADAIAPQKPFKGEERMLGAAEDIVRRGGQRGIGCTLVTQRSAVLNKNVLTQVQLLVVLRTIAPQDLAAIDAWIDVHGTDEERKLLKASLPSLPIGDAWFWSPGWPTSEGIFERVHVLPIETFDSAATPKPGEKRVEPKNLADVDLNVLKKQMAATIEKAKAEDPRELNKIIGELRKEIAGLKKNVVPREQDTKRIQELTEQLTAERAKVKPAGKAEVKEKKIIVAGDLTRLEQFGEKLATLHSAAMERASDILTVAETVAGAIREAKEINAQQLPTAPVRGGDYFSINRAQAPTARGPESAPLVNVSRLRETTGARSMAGSNGDASANITGGALRILQVLASKPDLKLTKPQLGTLAKMKHTGGSFSTYMSRLRSANLITTEGQFIQITDGGIEFIGADRLPEPLTSEEVLQQWLNTPAISGGAANMLKVLFKLRREGRGLTRGELAEAVNMEASGGSFSTYLSRLRSNGLIQEQGGTIYASDTLFINE